MILGGPDQRQRILRETGPAISRAGVKELVADPLVEAHAPGDVMHVGTDLFAQIGHLVDV